MMASRSISIMTVSASVSIPIDALKEIGEAGHLTGHTCAACAFSVGSGFTVGGQPVTWTTSVSGSGEVSVSMDWEHDVGDYAHWGGSFTASFEPRGARSDTPPPPDAGSAMGSVNKFWDLVPVGAAAGGAAALEQSTWTTVMAADDTAAAAASGAEILAFEEVFVEIGTRIAA